MMWAVMGLRGGACRSRPGVLRSVAKMAAFRMRFNVRLPPGASSGLHDTIDSRLTTWAPRTHLLGDSGRSDPDGRTIDLWLKLSEGIADDVRNILWNLIQVEPDVEIKAHRCHNNGAANAPCEYLEIYPKPVRAAE